MTVEATPTPARIQGKHVSRQREQRPERRSDRESRRGIVDILTERITTIPVLTVSLLVLLFIAGLTKILPRDAVNSIFKYIGAY